MEDKQSILPWDKPVVANVMKIFDAVVVKVDVVYKEVNANEEIYR